MTRAFAIALILLLVGGTRATAAEDLLARLHNATARGDCGEATALVRAIEQGADPRALTVLGERFEHGRRCLAPDPAHAAGLYARAAEQGEAVAMVRLGRLYVEGRGVPKDIAEARHWFRAGVLAVVALDAEVRARALRMALADGAVPRLLDQQLVWLSLIEAAGPASEFDLALRMRSGDGVPQNEVAAEHLMGKLAAEKYPPAWYELGRWQLARASDDSEKWEAFRHILMAAQLGHLPAMLELARRMLEGRDLKRNDYWTYVAFLEARERGADVEGELSLLEGRLDVIEVRAAREEAKVADRFPTFRLKD